MSDKKDAVNIGVTLSTQLISAALTMIGVLGAFTAFVIDKRDAGIAYKALTIISFASFVCSIFSGGKGINTARVNGHSGNWDIGATKESFNRQALLTLSGVLFFIASAYFTGNEKSDELKVELSEQRRIIDSLKVQYSLQRQELGSLRKENVIIAARADSVLRAVTILKRQLTGKD